MSFKSYLQWWQLYEPIVFPTILNDFSKWGRPANISIVFCKSGVFLTRFKYKRNSCCSIFEVFSDTWTDSTDGGENVNGKKCVTLSWFWRDIIESKSTSQIGHLYFDRSKGIMSTFQEPFTCTPSKLVLKIKIILTFKIKLMNR